MDIIVHYGVTLVCKIGIVWLCTREEDREKIAHTGLKKTDLRWRILCVCSSFYAADVSAERIKTSDDFQSNFDVLVLLLNLHTEVKESIARTVHLAGNQIYSTPIQEKPSNNLIMQLFDLGLFLYGRRASSRAKKKKKNIPRSKSNGIFSKFLRRFHLFLISCLMKLGKSIVSFNKKSKVLR